MKRKEVVEKRTENSKLYENQDHSFTREIFLEAVHYEDADGRWKEKEALECCLAGQGMTVLWSPYQKTAVCFHGAYRVQPTLLGKRQKPGPCIRKFLEMWT